jgi:hypothetical protein
MVMMSNSAPNPAGNPGSKAPEPTPNPAGNPGSKAPEPAPNPFDPKLLRLAPNFLETGSKEIITKALVGRPSPQTFFRINPLPDCQLDTAVIKWNEDRQVYLVAPDFRKFLANDIKSVRLYYYISDAGSIGLWDVGLPAEMGRTCIWWDTAHAAAREATTKWVRVATDNRSNCYRVFPHNTMKNEPVWPDLTFAQVLELAFAGRLIDRADHPIIKRLMGMC